MSFTKFDKYGREYVEASDGRTRYLRKRVEQEPQYGPEESGSTPVSAPTRFTTPKGREMEVVQAAGERARTWKTEWLARRKAVYVERGVPVVKPKERSVVIQEEGGRFSTVVKSTPLGLLSPSLTNVPLLKEVDRTITNMGGDSAQVISDGWFRDLPELVGRPYQIDASGRSVNPLPSVPRVQSVDGNYWGENFVTSTGLMVQVILLVMLMRLLFAKLPIGYKSRSRYGNSGHGLGTAVVVSAELQSELGRVQWQGRSWPAVSSDPTMPLVLEEEVFVVGRQGTCLQVISKRSLPAATD